jgi:hypothetical protein
MPALAIHVKCEKCKTDILITMPEPDIVNGRHTSALVWNLGADPVVCPVCGQAHRYAIVGIENVSPLFHFFAVNEPGASRIVVPGSSIPS